MAEWIPVNSSWIEAARYNEEEQSFDLKIDGKEYSAGPNFKDCTPSEFIRFLSSSSKGKWIHNNYPIHDVGGHRGRRGGKR